MSLKVKTTKIPISEFLFVFTEFFPISGFLFLLNIMNITDTTRNTS